MEARQRIEELTQILTEANYLYYVQDNPTMPDFEYDRLLRELEENGSLEYCRVYQQIYDRWKEK